MWEIPGAVPAAAAAIAGIRIVPLVVSLMEPLPSATSLNAAARVLQRMISIADTTPTMRAHGIPTDKAMMRDLLVPPVSLPLLVGDVVVVSGLKIVC